jgi:molybdopterin-guanine dinucleotide biosynthesis protein A
MSQLKYNNITGIILCGGKNSRMGKNKALLELGGKLVINHVIEILTPICNEIILSTNNNELDFLPYKKVSDKRANLGPIAGFQSTLLESSTTHNLIISCDTPFVSTALLSYLLEKSENYDVVLPSFNNHLQPMIGYFNKNFLKIIDHQIKAGNVKPINIFENANMLKVEITKVLEFYNEHLFFNINTKEQYEEAKRIYRSISG